MPTRLTKLSSPGFQAQKDLADDPVALLKFEKEWAERLSKTIAEPPRDLFYNPLLEDTPDDVELATVPWTAFPRRLIAPGQQEPDRNAYRQGDEGPDDPTHWPGGPRGWQDEYCEWAVERDPADGKITRVVFTSENPDYWDELFQVSPQAVADLYTKLSGQAVTIADLMTPEGLYNPTNRFNNSTTGGVIHLISPPNNLFAEIRLAADATVLRERDDGTLISQRDELIDCARFGAAGRHSDPTIGAAVNSLARDERAGKITLQDPFGLYIQKESLDEVAGFELPANAPEGAHPSDYWTIERGNDDFVLRASYEVPESHGFKVGDITINGAPIEFGGQIAQTMRIQLTAVFGDINAGQPERVRCNAPALLDFLDANLERIVIEPAPGAQGTIHILTNDSVDENATFDLGTAATLQIQSEVPITNPNFRVYLALVTIAVDAPSGPVFAKTSSGGQVGIATNPGLSIKAPVAPLAPRPATPREMAEGFRNRDADDIERA